MSRRKTAGKPSSKSNYDIEALLDELFRSPNILRQEEVLSILTEKIGDEKVIHKVFKYYTKRFNAIQKHVKEFYEKIIAKYGNNIPEYKILKKAREYADKYRLEDAEFKLFSTMMMERAFGKYTKYEYVKNTPMGLALGYEVKPRTTRLKIKDSTDKQFIDKIIGVYKASEMLNRQIKIQSFTYTDSSTLSLTGKFDQTKNTLYKFIHPLIAALFIPKITILEERMIMTNIAGLVAKLSKGEPIQDYITDQLYKDLVMDPNQQHEFSGTNVFEDLYNRSLLQTTLWEAINHLRTGRYYDFDSAKFETVLSKYPASIFDAPDMAYVPDTGNMLRKIMNAFSFRPTLVSVSKVQNFVTPFMSNNYVMSNSEDKKAPTSVSMINIRLPPTDPNSNEVQPDIKLSEQFSSSQWFTSSKYDPTVYTQKIISSNGVLFFYVNRYYSAITYNKPQPETNMPFSSGYPNKDIYFVNQLPLMFSDTQRVNARPVDANFKMAIEGSTFVLRSVVCVETFSLQDSEINMGTSSIIIDQNLGNYYYYHPHSAGKMNDGTVIDPVGMLTDNAEYGVTFSEKTRKYGTVFMYAKEY